MSDVSTFSIEEDRRRSERAKRLEAEIAHQQRLERVTAACCIAFIAVVFCFYFYKERTAIYDEQRERAGILLQEPEDFTAWEPAEDPCRPPARIRNQKGHQP